MLRHQAATLLVTLLTLVATVWLYLIIPKGFLPSQDTGLISAVSEAGTEVSFAQMQRLQAQVEEAIRKDPDVTGVVSVLGVSRMNPTPNAGRIAITLQAARRAHRHRRRDRHPAEAGGGADPRHHRLVPAGAGHPDQHPGEPRAVSVHAGRRRRGRGDRMGRQARDADAARQPACWTWRRRPRRAGLRMQVEVNREMAGRLGVSMQSVNDTLNDAFGQRQISTIYTQSNQYRVILEAQPRYQRDPSALSKLYVTGSSTTTGTVATVGNTAQGSTNTNTSATPNTVTGSNQVPLSTFARFEHTSAPLSIAHQEQFPSVTISFNLPRGSALSDAVAAIADAKRDIRMPGSVIGTYSGDSAEFDKSLAGQPWLILAAAITIYIVLGVLYESFIHPLTILSTLPSAGVGALLALMLFGYDLSVIALIGIVLLMGIVKKNAIMMIDFALDAEREQGMSPRDADRAGVAAALPPDHDDDARGAVRRHPARASRAAPARSCAIRSASPSSAGCC